MPSDEGRVPRRPAEAQKTGSASAKVEKPQANVHVSVTTETLNIHGSSLTALEQLATRSPDVAAKVIDATNHLVTHDSRKYMIGAICVAVVCCAMLVCSAAIIIAAGFWSGLTFFLVCAAAAAIFSAVFTGKSESLSWTVGFFRGAAKDDDAQKS